MFGDIVDPSVKVGSRKWYTVPVSIGVHTALLAAVVIIPLMASDILPVPPAMMTFAAPPPPPPPPPAPVRVGGAIATRKQIKHGDPVYPPIAQTARVQGIVILECTIGTDGRVTDVKVLRSVPLLDQAALDAVKQWTYTPTMLNGQAVAVIMTVTVNFALR